ncbi:MAG TPA: hypothetical protein VFC46_11225, partial [Humisphaera sp.]|nr:hypothetical protein [Humisphaera sp.]
MHHTDRPSRREMIFYSALLLAPATLLATEETPTTQPAEPIIDIHQHTNYKGRTDEQLLRHQLGMGVTHTILLPAGSIVNEPATHNGKSNGLAAGCGGNETVLPIARAHPGEYSFFANEVADLPEARQELTKYLKLGAKGIGEQKFGVACDSPQIEQIAEIAGEFNVPVLMHFQEGMYNMGFVNFHKILKKYPKVNFIGHAQSVWAYTDKDYADVKVLYPKGKVTPGGVTDRYLSDYPNFWADMSAGSGLNFLLRDEAHAQGFLDRHQDKMMFGSDCIDIVGRGPTCLGWNIIHTVRRIAPNKKIER